ncbi:membrane protein, partial [Streptomyces sp. NRRL F-6602]
MSGCGKVKAWQVPLRLITGAFILHSGMEKWDGPDEQAQGVHGMARQTFPFLENIDAPRFLKLLAAGEIALGAALLTPAVPTRLAGAALTGFAGSLMAVY